MTEFIEVADLGEIPPGGRKRIEVRGELITLFNLDGELFAIYDRCPHKKTVPLVKGNIEWRRRKMPQSKVTGSISKQENATGVKNGTRGSIKLK